MEQQPNFTSENKEKELKHYEKIIVSPGYPSKNDPSGLWKDTKMRLVFTALLFKSGRTDKIVVGGGMLHKMPVPFAELMKAHLIKLGVPENVVETEQDTYDTASQIEYIKNKLRDTKGNMGFLTDSAQAMYVKELLPRFELEEKLDILTIENVVNDLNKKNLLIPMLESFHNSIYWQAWWSEREMLLTALARIDPKGKFVEKIAKLWRNPRKTRK
ncbi:MAG: ElyC/SanA/YdcF family protein [archaeon]|nr:ElyC/SanA/YdcF family protein [archaeon]